MHCTAATQLGNKVQKLDTGKTKKLGMQFLGLLQLLGRQSAKPKHLLGKKKIILLGFGALFICFGQKMVSLTFHDRFQRSRVPYHNLRILKV